MYCNFRLQQPEDSQHSSADLPTSRQQSAASSQSLSSSVQCPSTFLPLKCSTQHCDERFSRMLQLIKHLNACIATIFRWQVWFWTQTHLSTNGYRLLKRTTYAPFWDEHPTSGCSEMFPTITAVEVAQVKVHQAPVSASIISKFRVTQKSTAPAQLILLNGDVKYSPMHLCYTDVYDQLGHIRLPAKSRQWLARSWHCKFPLSLFCGRGCIITLPDSYKEHTFSQRSTFTTLNVYFALTGHKGNTTLVASFNDATSVSTLVHRCTVTNKIVQF